MTEIFLSCPDTDIFIASWNCETCIIMYLSDCDIRFKLKLKVCLGVSSSRFGWKYVNKYVNNVNNDVYDSDHGNDYNGACIIL